MEAKGLSIGDMVFSKNENHIKGKKYEIEQIRKVNGDGDYFVLFAGENNGATLEQISYEKES